MRADDVSAHHFTFVSFIVARCRLHGAMILFVNCCCLGLDHACVCSLWSDCGRGVREVALIPTHSSISVASISAFIASNVSIARTKNGLMEQISMLVILFILMTRDSCCV
jgi:hypothetical protein